MDFERTEDEETIDLSAEVKGSYHNQYHVELQYHKKRNYFQEYFCECEAWQTYSGMCKHCVATALEAFYSQDTDEQFSMSLPLSPAAKMPPTDRELSDIIYASSMEEKARFLQPDLTGRVELVHFFKKEDRVWTVEFKIGTDHKYVLKNISQLVDAMGCNEQVTYRKKLAFYHERSVLAPRS